MRRLEREKRARLEAERLLEEKSLELYHVNQQIAASVAEVERERAVLGAVFDARSSALVLTDSTLTIVRVNPLARELFAVGQAGPEGRPMPDLLQGDEAFEDWLEGWTGPSPKVDDRRLSGMVRRANGSPVPVRVTCRLIGHDDLRLWVMEDLRRHLEAEAEREKLERSLVQAQKMEALGTLASGVAHEINTPIQYVGDNVSFLKEVCAGIHAYLGAADDLMIEAARRDGTGTLLDRLGERRRDLDIDYLLQEAPMAIEQSLHGLSQVASIVTAIREFSHPGDAEMKPVDMNAVIETTLSVSRNSWKTVATIEQDLDAELPKVPGQAGDLHQVILNLVANATDAIAERAPAEGGLIRISTERAGGYAVLRVRDNGTGVRDKHRSRIFDPFFTTKDPGKGTGQGLAIVYKIVHVRHGGRIVLDNTWGAGTSFSVYLPLDPLAPPA